MPAALALGAGLAGIAATTALARRESRMRRERTSGLLDGCRDLFERSSVALGQDGYPRLDGSWAGRSVRLAAVPDTLTLKRLPQLWLSTTLQPAADIPAGFAVLARPTGAEFFALTHRLPLRLEAPAPLSAGLLVRGDGASSRALVAAVADALAAILADPRVKEIAVTRRGLRAVVQAAEGRRGEYLLLRQSAFAGPIDPGLARTSLQNLLALDRAIAQVDGRARATLHA